MAQKIHNLLHACKIYGVRMFMYVCGDGVLRETLCRRISSLYALMIIKRWDEHYSRASAVLINTIYHMTALQNHFLLYFFKVKFRKSNLTFIFQLIIGATGFISLIPEERLTPKQEYKNETSD